MAPAEAIAARSVVQQFEAAELVALTKVEARKAREDLTPGAHEVDVRVHVAGSIFVAGDFEQKPRLSQEDLLQALAAALRNLKRGVTPQLVLLQAQVEPAGEKVIEALKGQLAEQVLAGRPTSTCKGGVRAVLELSRL